LLTERLVLSSKKKEVVVAAAAVGALLSLGEVFGLAGASKRTLLLAVDEVRVIVHTN